MCKVTRLVAIVATMLITSAVQAKPSQVIAEPIQFESSSEQIQAVGNAEAIQSVILYPATGDKVTAVHFSPGDHVEAGTLLLELDSRRQKAALKEAQIRLADAQRTVERLTDSQKRGAVPINELDKAVTERDLAKVAVVQAENELEDRRVIAPFSGVMGLTDVEVGDRITTQTAIASIDNFDKLYVQFAAPESAYSMLKAIDNVLLTPWNDNDTRISADIAQMDSRIDPTARTLRVKAIFDNQNARFLPGMSFRVSLTLLGQEFAVIPEAALLWGATGPYVWKEENGKAKRVDVKIQQRLPGKLLVSGELAARELLVVEGVQRLRPGQEIAITNALARE
ncbi:efflux RND transporter periplasmic adaptor subunit [Pseudoalteromonas sp. J010]|uniref:efflux RND transporter periplasmic adaptor subunit n=1 Tax=unclassified Pseudoalteromonas TaxID=194690 RepID=UPI000F64A33D|nr:MULTISPECIES: efflux RND transporter periplasmic adaptor subunit [unclassified Pseudoalteromonas]RRS07057.1 efflux RND transporter periplasmic adaptor subunit [Pseudoalteromonas sp. J010]USD30072.1 efflux RND transporter periplasmic adaptor subunit [Pseudoalteromonas sp. SCSIO 43201]